MATIRWLGTLMTSLCSEASFRTFFGNTNSEMESWSQTGTSKMPWDFEEALYLHCTCDMRQVGHPDAKYAMLWRWSVCGFFAIRAECHAGHPDHLGHLGCDEKVPSWSQSSSERPSKFRTCVPTCFKNRLDWCLNRCVQHLFEFLFEFFAFGTFLQGHSTVSAVQKSNSAIYTIIHATIIQASEFSTFTRWDPEAREGQHGNFQSRTWADLHYGRCEDGQSLINVVIVW